MQQSRVRYYNLGVGLRLLLVLHSVTIQLWRLVFFASFGVLEVLLKFFGEDRVTSRPGNVHRSDAQQVGRWPGVHVSERKDGGVQGQQVLDHFRLVGERGLCGNSTILNQL